MTVNKIEIVTQIFCCCQNAEKGRKQKCLLKDTYFCHKWRQQQQLTCWNLSELKDFHFDAQNCQRLETFFVVGR